MQSYEIFTIVTRYSQIIANFARITVWLGVTIMIETIKTITFDKVIPSVFVGDNDYSGDESQVWLRGLTIRRGEMYCVDASSGRGKTSLCSFLYGLRNDYQGKILFNDADISRLSINEWCELRKRHIAYLPQELDVFGELTAMENVLLKNSLTDFFAESDIRRMFEMLEIDNRINTPVGRMSVGQSQRVALIRSLCQPFDFILLDEPVSHLDATNNRKCADLVTAEASRRGAAVVFTSVGNPLSVDVPVKILKL